MSAYKFGAECWPLVCACAVLALVAIVLARRHRRREVRAMHKMRRDDERRVLEELRQVRAELGRLNDRLDKLESLWSTSR